jgi:hypothetical protein
VVPIQRFGQVLDHAGKMAHAPRQSGITKKCESQWLKLSALLMLL